MRGSSEMESWRFKAATGNVNAQRMSELTEGAEAVSTALAGTLGTSEPVALWPLLWSQELHISEFRVLSEYLRQKVFRVCIEYFQSHRFFGVPSVQF